MSASVLSILPKIGSWLIKLLERLLGKELLLAIRKAPWPVRLAFWLLTIIASAGATYVIREFINRWGDIVDRSEYGFEDSNDVGWVASKDEKRGLAFSSAGISSAFKIRGKSSMLVHVNLDGTEEGRRANLHQGEIMVDVRFHRSRSHLSDLVLTSLDFSNETITGGISIPPTLVGKDPSHPIFVQMFLEPCDASKPRFSLYPPRDIAQAGLLGFKNKTTSAMNEICKMGIKMGLNDVDHNVYVGEIYIDAIDW